MSSDGGSSIAQADVEIDPLPIAAPLEPSSVAGLFDQDPPHRLGRRPEEMAAREAGRWSGGAIASDS